jgi:hypothetical protein
MEVNELLADWSDQLLNLAQNRLVDESTLIRFIKARGVPVSGVVAGDPGKFYELGWLPKDKTRSNGAPLYHPFRFYTIHRVLSACRIPVATSASLDRNGIGSFVDWIARERMPKLDRIGEWADSWNRVVAFCILLEPIYWPQVTGYATRSAVMDEAVFEASLERYDRQLRELVTQLDPEEWRKIHEDLRVQAAMVDDNGEMYLLLRTMTWEKRKRLKGHLSCALWIRHMAEMIRKSFESIHGVEWPEEDRAFGWWPSGSRENMYGSSRPLDDLLESQPRLALYFGLSTGCSVRWYVEGDTEYYAVVALIPEPSKVGIELVNLKGNIASERSNIAMKLADALKNDCTQRRFSILSFDKDVPANVKAIRRYIENGLIVGYIAAHDPDFEYANFSLNELVEVAARMDESLGFPGKAIREANWSGIVNAKQFEKQYKAVSERRGMQLKGQDWGRFLAEYAGEQPFFPRSDSKRPLWEEVHAAMHARTANYDWQAKRLHFDPVTFKLIEVAYD